MKSRLLRVGDGGDEVLAEVFHCAHRLERAGDHLGSSRATRGVGHLGFKQFSVGEDDAQLIIQTVEQGAEFWCISHIAPLAHLDRRQERAYA